MESPIGIDLLSQGSMANRAGSVAEDLLEAMLGARYMVDRQVTVGHTIYGGELRADLLIRNHPRFPRGLAIESKWQDTPGSVDEKLPYLLLNIQQCYPCPVIVVLDGGGCRPGAKEWLQLQVDGEKLIAVFSLQDLARWLIRETL